jgi:hypothetical protein
MHCFRSVGARGLLALGIVLALCPRVGASCPTDTNEGADFLFAWPLADIGFNVSGTLVVLTDDTTGHDITVTIPNSGTGTYTATVSASSPYILNSISMNAMVPDSSSAQNNYYIHVASDDGVSLNTVIFKNKDEADTPPASEDAFLAIPRPRLKRNYWPMGATGPPPTKARAGSPSPAAAAPASTSATLCATARRQRRAFPRTRSSRKSVPAGRSTPSTPRAPVSKSPPTAAMTASPW